ncbi:hypothetical protein STENM223S_04623 [Streptomyces tendae]
MDGQRERGERAPQWRWHGPPWWNRRVDEERRPRWPWASTALVTAFVLVGSNFAVHAQEGERARCPTPSPARCRKRYAGPATAPNSTAAAKAALHSA